MWLGQRQLVMLRFSEAIEEGPRLKHGVLAILEADDSACARLFPCGDGRCICVAASAANPLQHLHLSPNRAEIETDIARE